MAELQFAKTFLAALDGCPVKLPADYAEDARTYPARPPYILPRMPRPMRKPATAAASSPAASADAGPGQTGGATVSVRSLHRSPNPLDVEDVADGKLLPLATTSLLDVRTLLAERSGVPLDKLRLLYRKKPVADSKVLQDLLAGDEVASPKIELGVMVVGGAATVAAATAAAAAAADAKAAEAKAAASAEEAETAVATETKQTPRKPDGVETQAFWNDLHGFLAQRLADSKQADEVFSLFLRAWEERME